MLNKDNLEEVVTIAAAANAEMYGYGNLDFDPRRLFELEFWIGGDPSSCTVCCN